MEREQKERTFYGDRELKASVDANFLSFFSPCCCTSLTYSQASDE
jgi:hypothetical protein